MKVCSICQRHYADSLKFCLDDGTVLSAAAEPAATLVDPQATLRLTARETESSAAPKRNRSIVWIALGGVGLIAVIGLAAVVLLFSFGSANAPTSNATTNASTSGATPAEQLTAGVAKEVERVNNEIGLALLHGDPDSLARLLADDYRYVSDVGLTLNKLEVLALIRTGNLSYEDLTSTDVKVELNKESNKADLTARGQSKGQLRRQPFTDIAYYRNSYEKREGRWQLVSETVWHRQ